MGLTLWSPVSLAGSSEKDLAKYETDRRERGIPEYSLAEALELAEREGPVRKLALRDRVEKLPDLFWQLRGLELLDLRNCGLRELSSGIENLTGLKTLDLYGNQLSELPEIGNLTNLEFLDLSNNQLSELPYGTNWLTSLKELYLRDNELSTLPPRIWNLTSLESLDLGGNELRDLKRRAEDSFL